MNKTELTYLAELPDQHTFLRDILYHKMQLSHSLVVRLKQQNKIMVNGHPTRTNYLVQAGDLVSVDLGFTEENHLIPEPLPIDILYEDEDLMAVNKPPGMATHPSRLGGTGTLANAVTYYWQSINCQSRFRPINRLDRDTSGIVLIGKNHFAHQALFQQKSCRIIEKSYLAIVEGVIKKNQDCINQPIAQLDEKLRKRSVHPDGYPAVTHYNLIRQFPEQALLSLKLETGRTHQIRVHLSFIGHPVCGDSLYGFSSPLIERQALHAAKLHFTHPRSSEEIILEAVMPKDMENTINHLASLSG